MENEKLPDNWRDYKDGSAQACMAEMSVNLLNNLCILMAQNPSKHHLAKSGFEMGVHSTDSNEEILIEVTMQITFRDTTAQSPVLN